MVDVEGLFNALKGNESKDTGSIFITDLDSMALVDRVLEHMNELNNLGYEITYYYENFPEPREIEIERKYK